MANQNAIASSAEKPYEVEFVDQQRVRSTVLRVDADPADPTGATPRVTIGGLGVTTSIPGDVDGVLIQPSAIVLSTPVTEFAARAAATAGSDIVGSIGVAGGTGADSEYLGEVVAESFAIDTDPIAFVQDLVDTGGDDHLAATAAPLPANTPAGTGGGHTLTANANGALVIDGVTGFLNGDRVLIKNEVDAVQNGVYLVQDPGDGSNPWVLTRWDNDWDTAVLAGRLSHITSGDTNADTYWEVDGDQTATAMEIDGVTDFEVGDIVLIVSAGAGSANARRRGVYVVTEPGAAGVIGAGGIQWVIARHPDFDSSTEMKVGATVTVAEGTAHTGQTWVMVPDAAFVIGTSFPSFTEVVDPADVPSIGLISARLKGLVAVGLTVDGTLSANGNLAVTGNVDIDGTTDFGAVPTLFSGDRYFLTSGSGPRDEFFDAATINGASLSDAQEHADIEIPAGAANATLQTDVNSFEGMEKTISVVADGGGSVTITAGYRTKAGDGAQPVSITFSSVNDSARLKAVLVAGNLVWQIRQVTGTATVNY